MRANLAKFAPLIIFIMSENTVNIRNKRARFEYHISDTFVAGIQLSGTEIKSIRMSKASILEA